MSPDLCCCGPGLLKLRLPRNEIYDIIDTEYIIWRSNPWFHRY